MEDFESIQSLEDSITREISSFITNISRKLDSPVIVDNELSDMCKFLFGEFSDFSIYINGYDEYLEGCYTIANQYRAVRGSIRIKSTQGDTYNLDDYFRSCVCRWEKVK
jgi:hypothetical protein